MSLSGLLIPYLFYKVVQPVSAAGPSSYKVFVELFLASTLLFLGEAERRSRQRLKASQGSSVNSIESGAGVGGGRGRK